MVRGAREELRLRGGEVARSRAFVAAHNAAFDGASSYALALNAFADLTPDEFRAARLGLAPGLASATAPRRAGNRTVFRGFSGDVPESIDWREKGAVTDVKDQGSCGYIYWTMFDIVGSCCVNCWLWFTKWSRCEEPMGNKLGYGWVYPYAS